MSDTQTPTSFSDLALPEYLLKALSQVGYEHPTPIQEMAIPALLNREDVLGMAQTGTGKTAAFALPILANINIDEKLPQALVLCPTRDLALQVSEAFQAYASHMKGFHVLPIYGDHDMRTQLRGLKRGVHVIVGTPGRSLDLLERRSLDLSNLRTLILDEADEMLRMGFNEDVEAILDKTARDRQIAIFSETLPPPIRRVADIYLKHPKTLRVEAESSTSISVEQRFWLVAGTNKLDALTRILEVESFDGMIIFVRTKTSTIDLAEKLNARGFSAAPLNGDMNPKLQTLTVDQLKSGQLDILVATDVAARGLESDRISHVFHFDIPYDDDTYIRRVRYANRAVRRGKTILFVAPRERRVLRSIEKTTQQQITQMKLPTRIELIDKRVADFKSSISSALDNDHKAFFHRIIAEICHEQETSPEEVAAALAYLVQKERPILPPKNKRAAAPAKKQDNKRSSEAIPNLGSAENLKAYPEIVMERFRIAVGRSDQVTASDIAKTIASAAQIDTCYIGLIDIHQSYSTVDLPAGMPEDLLTALKQTRIGPKILEIERVNGNQENNPESSSAKLSPNIEKRDSNNKRDTDE